jgi:hypothetical protein
MAISRGDSKLNVLVDCEFTCGAKMTGLGDARREFLRRAQTSLKGKMFRASVF